MACRASAQSRFAPRRCQVITSAARRSAMRRLALMVLFLGTTLSAQIDPRMVQEMRWRMIGPFRGGRTVAAVGVRNQPNVFYIGVNNGGVWKTTDYGRIWTPIFDDQPTGSIGAIAVAPSDPNIIYVGSGLFKSTDGGSNWRQLTSGLPGAAEGLGRIGIEVSSANPNRLYAIVGATKLGGVYRSDDAGESWQRVNTDDRLWGRDGDFNEVRADPKNPDVIYVANVVTWKSTDGGKTFGSFRGAPGGDDYHRVWINPADPKTILIASDQGAIVTVNGGESWSSWYNQPTAQLYHVSADNSFPYRVCSWQQESGSACVQSRGDEGQITFREWRPVAVEEYGYAVPDPLDPDIIYGGK